MTNEGTELRTERLLLRPFLLDDVDDVFAYAKDPEWARYLAKVPQPYARRNAEEHVARSVLASWETHPVFALEYDSRVVGGVNLTIRQPDDVAELGYSIAKPLWGKGLMPEAAGAVINWGFERSLFAKVYAIADLRNVRSHRVMEKLGMTREGVLRSHMQVRGERIDVVVYGLLREEWERSLSQQGQEQDLTNGVAG